MMSRLAGDGGTLQRMRATWGSAFAVVTLLAAAIATSAAAAADPDIDFDNAIASKYQIYGAHDYNPYIAKIACHRLGVGVDPDAAAAEHFIKNNLARGTTDVQAYEFLGTAISIYCPELAPKLQNIPAR